jgi:lysine biosynthesis protein LysW
MVSPHCPDCDESINLRNRRVGRTLFCPYCDAEVEAISADPLVLGWAYDSSYDEDRADEDD